jgi:hypothetical protein
MSGMSEDRFWVGQPVDSRMLWVYDALMPHEDPYMVYLFNVRSNSMREYERSFARYRLKTAIGEQREQAIVAYSAWYEKNGANFLANDAERSRREMAERAHLLEQRKASAIERHKEHLANLGIEYRGVRFSGAEQQRSTHCYSCKAHLDSRMNIQCASCGWLICSCGACGCGYGP